jgi:hypothetical protein
VVWSPYSKNRRLRDYIHYIHLSNPHKTRRLGFRGWIQLDTIPRQSVGFLGHHFCFPENSYFWIPAIVVQNPQTQVLNADALPGASVFVFRPRVELRALHFLHRTEKPESRSAKTPRNHRKSIVAYFDPKITTALSVTWDDQKRRNATKQGLCCLF